MKTAFKQVNVTSDGWRVTCGGAGDAGSGRETTPPFSRFTLHVSRLTFHVSRFTLHASHPPSHSPRPAAPPRSQRGIALVITLILLAVITFMAVTFLVVSRAQRGAVTTTTDQSLARMAADTALEQAKVRLIAPMLAFNNVNDYDLLVSTNYIRPEGFLSGNIYPTNVSYNYPNGQPVNNLNDSLQNLANLLYDSRPPVFITNRLFGSNEFRYYLDLNRNGRFEPSGFLPAIGLDGRYFDVNGTSWPTIPPSVPVTIVSNLFVGDPQWIGGLEKPGFPHSATNRFIYRWAFIALPAGKALDINYIHNLAKGLPPTYDGFFRNQGVGSWEMNLAAFLVDLNTNQWPFPQDSRYQAYFYNTNTSGNPGTDMSRGVAFEDARDLVNYRYAGNWKNLKTVPQFFFGSPFDARLAFQGDFVDGYTAGPLMTGRWWNPPQDNDRFRMSFGWPGSDNLLYYYTLSDLYDKSKTQPLGASGFRFTDRLNIAATNVSSYDRYTFYRLAAQLSTDSAPESPDKMNLNYDNLVQKNAMGIASATNFIPWRPIDFFTNAANRLLRASGYNPFVLNCNNIQIYPTNFYTPSVHRLLQLAANLYDATNTRTNTGYPYLPTVFRPTFEVRGNQVFIIGYREVTDSAADVFSRTMRDLENPIDRPNIKPLDMVSGIPLIIGAKKGLPNFNEFALQSDIMTGRKLQFRRAQAGGPITTTNQMFLVGISNVIGIQAWNSYVTNFARPLQLSVAGEVLMCMTNETGQIVRAPNGLQLSNMTIFRTNLLLAANAWTGSGNRPDFTPLPQSFLFPIYTNAFFLTNSAYRTDQARFIINGQDPPNLFPVPRLWLKLRARIRFSLVDTTMNRIVDYVNLDSTEDPLDITDQIQHGGSCDGNFNGDIGSLFCTNRLGNSAALGALTYGMKYQMDISAGFTQVSDAFWRAYNLELNDRVGSQNEFRRRLLASSQGDRAETLFNAPFTPRRLMHRYVAWQVNDPLVHYTVADLRDRLGNMPAIEFETVKASPFQNFPPNRNYLNDHYRPWGGNPNKASDEGDTDTQPPTNFELGVKDPALKRTEDYEFPTNKFANIGWLGRVHRGSPWQTVDMKSFASDLNVWAKWSGNLVTNVNAGQLDTNRVPFGTVFSDAALSHPIEDRLMFDLFTTSFNENAGRGKLSINQTNLASWSALLGGAVALQGDPAAGKFSQSNYYAPVIIQPVGTLGTNSPLWQLVNSINQVRNSTNFNFNGSFRHLGDILAVPELTTNSPFLNLANLSSDARKFGLGDAVYERLPQQIMSLLTVNSGDTPRFVIYAYGQALKPADHSIYLGGGPFSGICTNYQITAEAATRAVVRIEGSPDVSRNAATEADPLKRYPLRVVVESFNPLPPD